MIADLRAIVTYWLLDLALLVSPRGRTRDKLVEAIHSFVCDEVFRSEHSQRRRRAAIRL